MSGKKSRDKGLRREREFAKLFKGERVPLSGAAGGQFNGDVILPGKLRAECKSRRDGWKQLYLWLEGVDILGLRADHEEWIVCMHASLLKSMMAPRRMKLTCEDVYLYEIIYHNGDYYRVDSVSYTSVDKTYTLRVTSIVDDTELELKFDIDQEVEVIKYV